MARPSDHVIPGIQAASPGMSEMAAGFALAIEAALGLTSMANHG